MSKHTKGPWCAAIDECATVRDSRDNQLAMVTYLFTKTGGRRSGDEVSANARLIAAAPELLEACKTFHEWLVREEIGFANKWDRNTEEGESKWREWYDENLRLCALAQEQARAAIAKAKGEK